MALTEKRRRFVDYFMGQAAGNATEAARLAGYKQPHSQGSRLLGDVEVQQALKSHPKTRARVKTRDDRQEWWSSVMDDGEAPLKERLRASELLGKSQADFVDRHKVEMGGMTPEEIEAAAVEMFKAKPELWERIKREVEG